MPQPQAQPIGIVIDKITKPNIKKLDEVDVVFVDNPWTEEELKALSIYLRKRKLQRERRVAASLKKSQVFKKLTFG